MHRKELAPIQPRNASKLRIGIVVSSFHEDITGPMLEGALAVLQAWKVKKKNIEVLKVPGGFEIPLGCARLLRRKKFDALVAIGCIIKGESKHDEYISMSVAQGLMRLMVDRNVPIAFGVITPNSLAQARVRSRGETNHGSSAARAALRMALGKM